MALNSAPSHNIAVIGGGPAGLMAAEVLAGAGMRVDLYDAMPSPGRKFLLAGKGGLNLTYAEPLARFPDRYGARRSFIGPLLQAFTPDDLRAWAHGLGIETFAGSSGRVFPAEMKSAPLLRAWLHRLRCSGVTIHVRHRWHGWSDDGALHFVTPNGDIFVTAQTTVLALGGGSWPQLGSDGSWVPLLQQHGVLLSKLQPSNCGFELRWSDHLRSRFAGHPVKSVTITFKDQTGRIHKQHGEFVVTDNGIEGNLIYALSASLRDTIIKNGPVIIELDLSPDKSEHDLRAALTRPRGPESMANHVRKRTGIKGVKAALLREVLTATEFSDPAKLAATIKSLPLTLRAFRPLSEAISTAGGVLFEELDENLMLKKLPGVFCAGEMLDWEAPTGGYLLTACFATGHAAGRGARQWLRSCSARKNL